jgi:replicative DNA helicase
MSDNYEIKTLDRIFKKLDKEDQQAAWLKFSEVMEGYSKKQSEQFELELMSDYTDEAIERNKNFGQMQGLSSGYNRIDELTKGFVDGELTIVAGQTSYGKTTLAINIANKVALSGKPVLFITLEMTKPEITSRFMHINGGNNEDYTTVAARIAYQVTSELDWRSIDRLVERFIKQFDHGLIVIDHLHYFTRELEHVSEDLGRVTKQFKKNAQDHNVPVILVSHIRRIGKNENAGIDDLRGSSYIAQDSDIVLLVGRKKEKPNLLKVFIEKNRNRGYDYENNVADLYIDGIKIYNEKPIFE